MKLAGVLAGLLALSALGEGGATPLALLFVHAALVAIFLTLLARGGRAAAVVAPLPLAAWSLFLVLASLGALLASYHYAAYLVLVELAASFGVAFLAARVGVDLLPRLGTALLWGGAAEGMLACYQHLVAGQPRPAGTFLNPNHLGAWLLATILLGLPAWGVRPGGAGLLLRGAAAVPAVAGLFLCGSRGALVGLAAAALFVVVVAARRLERPHRARVMAGAAALLLACGIGVAVRMARGSDPFLYQRLGIWRASLGAVAEAPWTGAGPGQFKSVALNLNFPLENRSLRYEKFFESPHSDLLRVPCELGWPAAAAFFLALALTAQAIARRLRTGALPPSALAACAVLVGLLAQAAVDDLTDRPALYLLACALAGSLLATPRESARGVGPGLRAAAALGLVIVFVVGELAPVLALQELAPSLVLGGDPREDLPRGRLDPAGRVRLARARAWNPLHPDVWLRTAEDIAGSGADLDLESYAAARAAAEHAIRLQPSDARYRLGLARLERLACATYFRDEASRARARSAYHDAEARSLHDPLLSIEEAHFLLATGDAAGARRAAERALTIEPRAIPPRLLLAEAIVAIEGAPGRERATALVTEAEESALRLQDAPRESAYARALLSFDPRWARALRARLSGGSDAERVASAPSSP